jgi:hypothetical protein
VSVAAVNAKQIARCPGRNHAIVGPLATHTRAVFELLPRAYRLPLIVIDSTGMRVSEVQHLQWGDVDEIEGR